MKKTVGYIAIALMALAACKKNENEPPRDTEAPSITLSSPAIRDEFLSGTAITVVADFADNRELGQYRIEISDNFDSYSDLQTGCPKFYFDTTVAISGTQASANITIQVPTDVAAGPYRFIMTAQDKAGNAAPVVGEDITIKNSLDSVPPMLLVATSPSAGSGMIYLQGTQKSIGLLCNAEDNELLKGYQILLINKNSNVAYVNTNGPLNGNNASFNNYVYLDEAWPKGDYTLVIRVFDRKNNIGEVNYDVYWKK